MPEPGGVRRGRVVGPGRHPAPDRRIVAGLPHGWREADL